MTAKVSTNGARQYNPPKKQPSFQDALPDEDLGDPKELAKSFTSSEAKAVVGMKLTPISTAEFMIEIAGDDLITHKWSEKAIKEMLKGQQMSKEEKKLAKINREKKSPEDDFEGARYHWDGKDWFPANGIKKAMVSAGFGLGIPKSIIQRCVFVEGDQRRDFVEIKYARIVMRCDPVKVGPWNKREADLRYRPEYQNWSAVLKVIYRPEIITETQAATLIEHAGFSIGIGEWRPEKDGQAGRFSVLENKKGKKSHAS